MNCLNWIQKSPRPGRRISRFWRYRWRVFLIITAFILWYNEVLVHYLRSYNWAKDKCHGNCTRILLVADPQLIGETFDENLYNGMAIYDSDNYLRKTFNRAMHHVRPDMIIFLGDIFDEGSVASPEAYRRYINRFHRIFRINPTIPTIIIPGDNDIGGENGELITTRSVNRFREAFNTLPFYKIGNTIVYPVNKIAHETPKEAPREPEEVTNPLQRTILISHFSLLFQQSSYSEKVLKLLKPTIIFSGHLHRSLFIKRSQLYTEFTKANPLNVHDHDKFLMHEFDLGETIRSEGFLEILVPTCSYRMGEKSTGYGMAIIDHLDDNLYYTVLWSVERFLILYEYLILLSCWVIAALIWALITLIRRCKRRKMDNYSKI